MNNSQTLCSICNSVKSIHEINFRVFRSQLSKPKEKLEWNSPSNAEYETEVIKRTINIFYHCQALSEIKFGSRSNSKYYSVWEICLFEGNNPEWLAKHTKEIVSYLRENFNYVGLKKIIIK